MSLFCSPNHKPQLSMVSDIQTTCPVRMADFWLLTMIYIDLSYGMVAVCSENSWFQAQKTTFFLWATRQFSEVQSICLIISGHPKDGHANSHEAMIIKLVGGFNPSEKYELVSWDDCSHVK